MKQKKEGLIGVTEAAEYLDISHQYLGKLLAGEKEGGDHPLLDYFRQYAGRWRTTYALLDEYFTNAKLTGHVEIRSQKGKEDVDKSIQGVP